MKTEEQRATTIADSTAGSRTEAQAAENRGGIVAPDAVPTEPARAKTRPLPASEFEDFLKSSQVVARQGAIGL